MNLTYNVRFWEIQTKKNRRRPYGVRWITAGREHQEWYATKALANSRRSELIQAARKGEPFDVDTGLPASMVREESDRTLLDVAREYVAGLWADAPPTTRKTVVDSLAGPLAAFVRDPDSGPEFAVLRHLLVSRLLPPSGDDGELTGDLAAAAHWLESASRPVADLTDKPTAREFLRSLSLTTRGRSAAPSTVRSRRANAYGLLQYVVEAGLLDANPLAGLKVQREHVTDVVDPRVVVNPAQARQLLAAVTYVGTRDPDRGRRLLGFFACLYYAGLRPAEALALGEADCDLPSEGWGELLLWRSLPATNSRYTNNGAVHEQRSLKRRADREVRPVPIPPALVAILREHLDRYGTAADGRLFSGTRGGVVPASAYHRVWHAARLLGLSPQQAASPLARRPYDLRHAAVSTWLNAGVPVTEVAARAGHSVAVLLNVYAKCMDGQREHINRKIDDALQ
ncbi:tyrosine-type recombinase/integrase [Gandjariella thermophila]|uniref:Integrase n=1 Tax=Gandjariella thermophila TaxID=1931992 RepID=A0A4D4JGH5_9PSEU|nr:tyrosine-type recombinase/integrase [Gandjariella thermophila]GDY32993.1 integrase [Gandjariella thermophila]